MSDDNNKKKPIDGDETTKPSALEEASRDDDDAQQSHQFYIDAIQRLIDLLQNDQSVKNSAPKLSHYRIIPKGVEQAYNVLHQGSEIIYSTSTKFTLVGKLVSNEQYKLTQDLLRGCELLGAATLTILNNNASGCSRSVKQSVVRACLSIFVNVIRLIQCFQDGTGFGDKNNNIGAQKTGAVWQSCDTILKKLLPQGNRTAIRREIFTWTRDCNDTMEEFQDMIDLGPLVAEEVDGEDAILLGNDQQYTENEIPIAKVCVGLIKCSRGCMKLSLETCEELGNKISSANDNEHDEQLLESISKIHDIAKVIGDGVTDFGSLMYPPLFLSTTTTTDDTNTTSDGNNPNADGMDELKQEFTKQVTAILELQDYILGLELGLSTKAIELARTLRNAAEARLQEVSKAITDTQK